MRSTAAGTYLDAFAEIDLGDVNSTKEGERYDEEITVCRPAIGNRRDVLGSRAVGVAGRERYLAQYRWRPSDCRWDLEFRGRSVAVSGQLDHPAQRRVGRELAVANGGQLYALGVPNWYVWQNGAWHASSDPLTNAGSPGTRNAGRPSAGTVVLNVGPSGQYQTISDAVAFADVDTNLGNHYDIQVMPGTYTNDFPYVTRPLTIKVNPSYAGSPVVLEATVPLPNAIMMKRSP